MGFGSEDVYIQTGPLHIGKRYVDSRQEGDNLPYVFTCENGVNKEEHGDNKGDSSPI